jgi:hypothetical protein
MGKKDVNEFADKETAREDSTPPKHKTAKDNTANPLKKRGRTTSLNRGEISRGEKKDRNNT